jgi:hypothetical protein
LKWLGRLLKQAFIRPEVMNIAHTLRVYYSHKWPSQRYWGKHIIIYVCCCHLGLLNMNWL